MLLDLTPDALLATTRSVRRRLDLTRPVEREVLEECLRLGQQAPTASYAQNWHFVVVTDPERRAALGELWRSVAGPYVERRAAAAAADERVARISAAVRYLADHIHQVPVHVIPCVEGRTDHAPVAVQESRWGSIIPAAWSFMLAARARGLGTVWTTFHLRHEREAAELLGIPFDEVMQAALIPVAYSVGTTSGPQPATPWTGWFTWSSSRPAGSRPTDDPPAHLGAPFGDVAGNMSPCTEPARRAPRSRPWGRR
jgi:nitroreductase